MQNAPRLIETGVRNYMQTALQTCHENRIRIYSTAFNVLVLVTFVFVFSLALYYSYINKPSDQDKYKKQLQDQQYVLSKIRLYHTQKELQREQVSRITDLPTQMLHESL
jgi:Na+/phosphate symporter